MRFPRSKPSLDFRFIPFALSATALVLGLWITSAELIRPHSDIEESKGALSGFQKGRAETAATIGAFRGDLWAEDALINSGLDMSSGTQSPVAPADRVAASAAARRALSLAPLDARLWLLLAASNAASKSDSANAISALEMAYLTGQQDARLLPARLVIAARSKALSDPAIQDFVKSDITLIFAKLPGLKPALLTAYRASTAENRPFLEHAISAASPAFLTGGSEKNQSP